MRHLKTILAALGVLVTLSAAAAAEEQADKSGATPPVPQAQATPPVPQAAAAPPVATAGKCLEAVVNPVTGYAFCTNPRGAPVDPPARASLNRPCKPRAHDDDAFTVYEHYSGCDE